MCMVVLCASLVLFSFNLNTAAASVPKVTETLNDLMSIYNNKCWNGGLNQQDLINAVKAGKTDDYSLGLTRYKCADGGSRCTSNYFGGGSQCWGFAHYIEYILYKDLLDCHSGPNYVTYNGNNIPSLQPGDYIRCNGHSAVVWKIENNKIYVVECLGGTGSGCLIQWDHFNQNSIDEAKTPDGLRNYIINNNGFVIRHWGKITINYYSNYADKSFEKPNNKVSPFKNVKVRSVVVNYNWPFEDGLHDYSSSENGTYLGRTGYKATGNWNTKTDGSGISINQKTAFANGQAFAKALGKDLSKGNVSIKLYPEWKKIPNEGIVRNKNGGTSDTFYVNAKDKKEYGIAMSMKKGTFCSSDKSKENKTIYGFYEIKVFGKQSDGSYKQISKNNVKNLASYTIKLKGYKTYKVQIYNWKTDTINKNKLYFYTINSSGKKAPVGTSFWSDYSVPKWRISKTDGLTYKV